MPWFDWPELEAQDALRQILQLEARLRIILATRQIHQDRQAIGYTMNALMAPGNSVGTQTFTLAQTDQETQVSQAVDESVQGGALDTQGALSRPRWADVVSQEPQESQPATDTGAERQPRPAAAASKKSKATPARTKAGGGQMRAAKGSKAKASASPRSDTADTTPGPSSGGAGLGTPAVPPVGASGSLQDASSRVQEPSRFYFQTPEAGGQLRRLVLTRSFAGWSWIQECAPRARQDLLFASLKVAFLRQ